MPEQGELQSNSIVRTRHPAAIFAQIACQALIPELGDDLRAESCQ